MANLGQKDGIYLARFRYGGREYKKSLKTRDRKEAENGLKVVETTIHRLTTGTLAVPDGVNPGTFILSGGTAAATSVAPKVPTFRVAVGRFEDRQKPLVAESYLSSQMLHLRHFGRHLGGRADQPVDRVTSADVREFLQIRLKSRHANTVELERQTLRQFFSWATEEQLTADDPAAGVKRVGAKPAQEKFHTCGEIEAIVARGGLSDEEHRKLWESLFLLPDEIGELLALAKENADDPRSALLHAIPAYTGMRRGEVIRLEWRNVDLSSGTLTAHSRKQSRRQKETPRTVDIHPDLAKLLAATDDARGRYVVPDDDATELNRDRANRLFWQPMRGTKWQLPWSGNTFKVGFHTYRHSFASNLAMAGIDQRVINELMGHTTEEMAKRYRHLIPAKTKAAVGVLDYGAAA
ncbi:tyrosine-type recombinase/integrase [Alienimonas californiensis]|uniref:Site-specific tyrosine recombinase XerD n=1 Tax=Alienimonas californiensis TaxID=2527989 RepID=A0A517PAH2_9PLAN|nr:site-specific integrase [Alienimonas californiensis]QDT16377.1 site-specific tyrosine recombinase XerD [Alienimonas californiensis]